jgi:glyoxylase-like metal-dependent hydrolase (beta-lactamase superfamily II)
MMATTFTVGAARITRIEESYAPIFHAQEFFPDWRPEVVAQHQQWMLPHHYDAASGFLKLSVHSWLVRANGRTTLIDTCVGNGKARPSRPFWHLMQTGYLDRLREAGVRPEQVDTVLCTHLHADHVGWNTRLEDGRWVPTFPNARYVFSQLDYDFYRTAEPKTQPAATAAFLDSVEPVVEAGLAELVTGAHAIDEDVSLEPAPGHTPGTVLITLRSRGELAVFSGDILHHAIQVYEPEWNSFACADAVNARASRRKVLERCAGSGGWLMPAHFGAPFVCHIDRDRGSFVPRF